MAQNDQRPQALQRGNMGVLQKQRQLRKLRGRDNLGVGGRKRISALKTALGRDVPTAQQQAQRLKQIASGGTQYQNAPNVGLPQGPSGHFQVPLTQQQIQAKQTMLQGLRKRSLDPNDPANTGANLNQYAAMQRRIKRLRGTLAGRRAKPATQPQPPPS